MSTDPALTDKERHIMVHACAWDHPRNSRLLRRNHYCPSKIGRASCRERVYVLV